MPVAAVVAEPESGVFVPVALPVPPRAASAAAKAEGVVALVADEFAAVSDEDFEVIESTDGRFCVFCNCEAWSIAWIIMVDMSEPEVTVVAVEDEDVAVVLFDVEESVAGVFADFVLEVAAAVAASSTDVVSETVSRRGDFAFLTVAGATIVIERVVGCCDGDELVAGELVGVLVVGVLELLLLVDSSSLCCCITSEKL